MEEQETQWYVLYVRSNTEKRVAKNLQELGFETLCPTRKTLRQWKDRKKKIDEVLFRNYVFVQTDRKRKNDVFQEKNVLRYLHIGSEIARITDKEVEMLKQLSNLPGTDIIEVDYSHFEVGETVEITEGPLRGYTAEIVAKDNSKVRLLVSSLHTAIYVEASALELRKKTP